MRAFFAEASFDAGGEQLTMVCDFYAIAVVEGVTGQNWNDIVPQLADPPFTLFVQVLYGLLRKRHEGITLDQVTALFYDTKERNAIVALMGAVIAKACNFDTGEDAPAKKKLSGASRTSERNG